MRVIGTAGHVDHGKSTLVAALTGTHPDRLQEEREREMTIDLGFAWLSLPSKEEVGIIDVPGHRDFIENMLAGVGGIDAALFVVAADEGVMPQTREHLAILDILQVQGGVIALTKIDLIEDSRSEWLELVEEDVRKVFSQTSLAGSPIVRVSSRTGEGIPMLLDALDACLSEKPPRPNLGRPRLPVDRAFTISGFGTVVTGTLTDGHLQVGDEIQVLPSYLKGRIRGLQTHKKKEDIAIPGSRTAVNISGIDVSQIHRGDVITHPGDYQVTRRLDVRFRLLPEVSQPLEHNTEVKLFLHTSEVIARLRLLGNEKLQPGEDGWVQLELTRPVVALRGDRYILRRPSPGETLGGGTVIDPAPKGRHKLFSTDTLSRLETLARGTTSEIIYQTVLVLEVATWGQALIHSSLEENRAYQALEDLIASKKLIFIERPNINQEPASLLHQVIERDSLLTSRGYWEKYLARINQEVENYHSANPLRLGIPREELRSRLILKRMSQARGLASSDLNSRLFTYALRDLITQGILHETGAIIQRNGFTIRFTPQQQLLVDNLMKRFTSSPYAPPSVKESQSEVGEEIFSALLELGVLIPMRTGAANPEIVFRKEDYEHILAEIYALFRQEGTLTAAQVRDHFHTSRRYALAILEHLDLLGITIREGDYRRLRTPSAEYNG